MKKSTKPWLPKKALRLTRNAQERLTEAYQGVDMSHDDLMANERYEEEYFYLTLDK